MYVQIILCVQELREKFFRSYILFFFYQVKLINIITSNNHLNYFA